MVHVKGKLLFLLSLVLILASCWGPIEEETEIQSLKFTLVNTDSTTLPSLDTILVATGDTFSLYASSYFEKEIDTFTVQVMDAEGAKIDSAIVVILPDSTSTDTTTETDYFFIGRYTLVKPVEGTLLVTAFPKNSAFGSTKESVILSTGAKPVLENESKISASESKIIEGSELTLSVTLSAEITVEYQWFKNGELIKDINAATLVFNALKVADAGEYYCIISNTWGKVFSDTFDLVFYDSTLEVFDSLSIAEGSDTSGSRVETNPYAFNVYAKDIDGVKEVTYTLNDTITGVLTGANNLYTLEGGFPLIQDTNTLEIVAIDSSTGNYSDTLKLIYIYNKKPVYPTDITEKPENLSNNIPITSGITLSWTPTISSDADGVEYLVEFGMDTIQHAETVSDTLFNIPQNALDWEKTVIWRLTVISGPDTMVYPTDSTLFTITTSKNDTGFDSLYQIIDTVSSGIKRITSPTGTLDFIAKDAEGVSAITVKVNDGEESAITIADSLYSFNYDFTDSYGKNTVVVTATDNSVNKNKGSLTVSYNYNTMPTPIELVSPLDSATDVNSNEAVTLEWTPAVDADGLDEVKYIVMLKGSEPQEVLEEKIVLTSLASDSLYEWQIVTIAGEDTVYTPSDSTYFTFTTLNIDATIDGLAEDTITISVKDAIEFTVTATDPEGVKEYRWDRFRYNSVSGTTVHDEATTSEGSITFFVSDNVGVTPMILTVVDEKGGETSKTIQIKTTNDSPIITVDSLISNTYDATSVIEPVITDDGGDLKVYYKLGSASSYEGRAGYTYDHSAVLPLPYVDTLFVKVVDNDLNEVIKEVLVNTEFTSTSTEIAFGSHARFLQDESGRIGLFEGDNLGKADIKAIYRIEDLSDKATWEKIRLVNAETDIGGVCYYNDKFYIAYSYTNGYISEVSNTGGLFLSMPVIPDLVGRTGGAFHVYKPAEGDQNYSYMHQVSMGSFVYDDNGFSDVKTDVMKFNAADIYQPTIELASSSLNSGGNTLGVLPTYRRADTVWTIHGVGGIKLRKEVWNFNKTDDEVESYLLFDKTILNSGNPAISAMDIDGDDAYILSGGDVYRYNTKTEVNTHLFTLGVDETTAGKVAHIINYVGNNEVELIMNYSDNADGHNYFKVKWAE